MKTEYKIKEEFSQDKENSKTLEQILEEIFMVYLVEKITEGSWKPTPCCYIISYKGNLLLLERG